LGQRLNAFIGDLYASDHFQMLQTILDRFQHLQRLVIEVTIILDHKLTQVLQTFYKNPNQQITRPSTGFKLLTQVWESNVHDARIGGVDCDNLLAGV
jgi:hypothetical protein